ncbi:aspartyl aminopeptidase [Suhomyces tanzawaensis NRRL Y-17324]|uniref:aspartyl aminopeptidase n=1 Tax=Suhomyces tanzawaensis NRRL Y-17324 TaxID=984487 RepID=A0A1E4SN95_9ASCO|nr:aspartyl aminopeptidase [Suhomyces tanzawaensis NRRL Y-17324]ODV80990.1 aspartyl aminopeptidase [Suhomyces tanzawaensis NRRL Y-17324]
MSTEALDHAQSFVDYLNNSPTPYHVVNSSIEKLAKAGFEELTERSNWNTALKRGGKYYVTRNASSLIAFTVGEKYENGNGIAAVGAHTDSPCLRIKPISKKTSEGFIQVGVESRVYATKNGQTVPYLVKIDKPLLRIPTLAIHFRRDTANKFEFNKETNMVPIAGQTALDKNSDEEKKPHSCADDPELQLSPEQFESVQNVILRHNKSLIELIAKEVGVEAGEIEDFELLLFDHQKSTIGGLNDEFIFSPRLDNSTSCFTATVALAEASKDLSNQKGILLISLFDHEEVGSVSAQGAESTFLPDIFQRITSVNFEGSAGDYFHQSVANSFMLSSDMAHGIHPNYSEAYEGKNRPHVNAGPVIKINANQRYATNSHGIVLIKKIANEAQVPLQLFVVRNDAACGSTIGPLISAKLGIKTLDLGNPQLSMHSIRETGGTYDVLKLTNLFQSFFENYVKVDESISRDHVKI